VAVLELTLGSADRRALRVLCVGAHCDDIEIGCGGSLLTWQSGGRRLTIDWVILSGTAERRKEAGVAMRRFVRPAYRGALLFGDFADGRFPAAYGDIKSFVESLKRVSPADVILCHARDDRHQDHRMVNEMVWSTFRDHLVLEYEVPKWDGDLGNPNVYVPVDARVARRKVDALMRAYRSQVGRDWFTPETFLSVLRLRGNECRSPSGYAEAFHGRKLRIRTS
jgi:LmbE family N-acetylglucosaminyl deacetylase